MCNQAPTVDQAIGPTGVEAESFHTLAGRRQSESYVIQGGQYWTPLGQSCRTLETPEHCSLRQAARGRLRPVSPRPQSSRSSFWTERTDFAFVQRDAFPYRLYSPRSMVASPSQNRLWADTYPALRTPAGPAPPPRGHSLAILFRFFFDPLRTRPGTGQGEWRGLGAGRDRGMYQMNGRRKQQQGRSGHGREGAARAHAMSPPPRRIRR